MIAFGRVRLPLLLAALLLVASGASGRPDGREVQAVTAGPSTTTTTTEPGRPATDRTTSTTATERSSTTSTTEAPDATDDEEGGDADDGDAGEAPSSTTTTRRSPATTTGGSTTSTTLAPSTTAAPTTTQPPPCPTGGIVWDASFSADPEDEGRWSVTVSGTITNQTSDAVDITSIASSVRVTSPGGEIRSERVNGKAEPRRLAPGGRATFTGTASVRSESDPAYQTTSVTARWADASLQSRCPAPR